MTHKIIAAGLAFLAAAFMWQALAQTDCKAACQAKYDACMKQIEGKPDNPAWELKCQLDYNDCLNACN